MLGLLNPGAIIVSIMIRSGFVIAAGCARVNLGTFGVEGSDGRPAGTAIAGGIE
jgi:hypothetical protein